jgi:hypothetical protein
MKHAIDSAPHSRIWHHRDLLPQTVLLTAAVFTTAAAPYIGALVSSALIIIFPLRYFRTLSTSACAGIVFTIASKEVGIDLSDDFARYYDIYKQFVENKDAQLLYGSFKPWEVGLPTLFLFCGIFFGKMGAQDLLLIFSVVTLVSSLLTGVYIARCLELTREERRILVGLMLLLFPVIVSTQLLRQFFAGLFVFAAWNSRHWSKRAGLLILGFAFHTSTLAIFSGLLLCVSWVRLVLFAIAFSLLFSESFVGSYMNFSALNLLTALEEFESSNTGNIIRASLLFLPYIVCAMALRRARWQFELRVFLFALLILMLVPNQQVAFRLTVPYFDIGLGILMGIIACQFGPKMRSWLVVMPMALSLYTGRYVEGAFLWQQYDLMGWPLAYIYSLGL